MNKNYIWLLDNGHGGVVDGVYQTSGKRSPVWDDGSQLYEGVFNRSVVRRLMSFCQNFGIKYFNLVPESTDPWNIIRARRANAVARYVSEFELDMQPVYLSVHGNAGGGSGWEVFTTPGTTLSDKLASVFYEKARLFLNDRFTMRRDFTDGDPDKEEYFTVLTETSMPALLTENLFMDTYRDCKYMMSEEGMSEIAAIHGLSMLSLKNNGNDEDHWVLSDKRDVFKNHVDSILTDPGEMPVTNVFSLKNVENEILNI